MTVLPVLPSVMALYVGPDQLLPLTSILGAIGGATILLAWTLNIEILKSPFHGQAAVKPNTALSIVLLGVSILLRAGAEPGGARDRVGRLSGTAVAMIGLITLCEWGFGKTLGIDQLLFREPAGRLAEAYRRRAHAVAARVKA